MAVGAFNLHYADTGEVGKPTVVLIHGTPGSWRALSLLFQNQELRQAARLVSIDRPGWGNSQLLGKEAEGDFHEQVRLIEPLIRKLKQESEGQPLVLVGHSYGASISPFFAYKYPELVDGIVMAAGAIDPELGKPRWYNYAANVWPVSVLIDEGLQKANVEIWGVHDALSELEPWWRTVDIPMVYLQGEDDELVHPDNLDFAESHLPAEYTRVVRLPDQGHFLHRQRADLIGELALDTLRQTESYAD